MYYDETQELRHYGVKGMKWGHRKKTYEVSDTRKKLDSAKSDYKKAKKEYNKAFNRAQNYSNTHKISQFTNKSKKTESDKRWDDAYSKIDQLNKSESAYKKAKKERKQKIKKTYDNIKNESSFKDKMVFNNATRKKAAKYVVDHNMSISDARKKAKKEAIRNTALLLSAYGAVTATSLYKYSR